jgi:transcriptional regulator with XRE-family HTH domain
MTSNRSLIGDVLTGGTHSFQPLPETRRTAASLASDADVLNRQTEWLHADASELRRSAQLLELEEQQTLDAVQSGRTLLTRLSDHGLSWTDIARIVGVSVPAVQKWRRGAGITGENRLRLARLAALLEILERYLIAEPCSWLEMPVITGVSVSGMDLLEADRYDLVLELARGEVAPGDRSSILDEFASDWRESRVDDAFEIVTANDGRLSIQARSQ